MNRFKNQCFDTFNIGWPLGLTSCHIIMITWVSKYACVCVSMHRNIYFIISTFVSTCCLSYRKSSHKYSFGDLYVDFHYYTKWWACLFCANTDALSSEIFCEKKNQMEIYVNGSKMIETQFWEIVHSHSVSTHTHCCVSLWSLWLYFFFCFFDRRDVFIWNSFFSLSSFKSNTVRHLRFRTWQRVWLVSDDVCACVSTLFSDKFILSH